MKIIRRLSLYQSVYRLGQINKTTPYIEKFARSKQNTWEITTEGQLYKYGYKNNPKTYKVGILIISAILLGVTINQTQIQLRNNETRTIYSYRIKQHMQSPLTLTLRRTFMWIYIQNLIAKINPYYEYLVLKGDSTDISEKHIRYRQYKYYMKNRSNKYDFMELGVLEKFPYPISPLEKQ